MRLQPRQELLSVWKSISRYCGSPDSFFWDDRAGRNSISDSELLLCLLLPPQKLPGIRYDRPDETKPDVRAALAAFGSPVEIPQKIVRLIAVYLNRYTDPQNDDLPVFTVGRYVSTAPDDDTEPTPEQEQLEVVDAYATSVVFCVTVIHFLRGYRPQAREAFVKEIDEVEAKTRKRLTAAMAALQRSFTISVFPGDSREGRALCETVSSEEGYSPALVGRLRQALNDVTAGLRELAGPREGGGIADDVANLLADRDLLFECGWSWGIVKGAEPVKTLTTAYAQPGFAESAPYLYFTVVAVDGIRDLLDTDTRLLGILDQEQQDLARTLQLQWELAQRFWSTIATFGSDRWPIEELPWRTTDEEESDYYSLLVFSLVRHSLAERNAPEDELRRIAKTLEDLADRGRIRRRPLENDPALRLHQPGTWVRLVGAETVVPGAPKVGWRLGELATLLLGRSLALAGQVNDHQLRARLLSLSDDVWRHLARRRLRKGKGTGLWDNASNVFTSLAPREEPSWYFTNRVVQCMGTAAELIRGEPPPGEGLARLASELLIEADDVFDEELLRGSSEGGPALRESMSRQESNLKRARVLLPTRPGTSAALVMEVLRELDKLAAARQREVGD
ncbi:SCO2524 family protein [Actinoplanes sp. GCM10030250]|uniref:SCO2524 family protein n=1 Tax=Actinoplanes sp. GCM10030250 TaxID=3273376 RepID=UPI0036144FE0